MIDRNSLILYFRKSTSLFTSSYNLYRYKYKKYNVVFGRYDKFNIHSLTHTHTHTHTRARARTHTHIVSSSIHPSIHPPIHPRSILWYRSFHGTVHNIKNYLEHKGLLEEWVWLPTPDWCLAAGHLLATAADQA